MLKLKTSHVNGGLKEQKQKVKQRINKIKKKTTTKNSTWNRHYKKKLSDTSFNKI